MAAACRLWRCAVSSESRCARSSSMRRVTPAICSRSALRCPTVCVSSSSPPCPASACASTCACHSLSSSARATSSVRCSSVTCYTAPPRGCSAPVGCPCVSRIRRERSARVDPTGPHHPRTRQYTAVALNTVREGEREGTAERASETEQRASAGVSVHLTHGCGEIAARRRHVHHALLHGVRGGRHTVHLLHRERRRDREGASRWTGTSCSATAHTEAHPVRNGVSPAHRQADSH